ncbi:hypothetical protein BGZ67_008705 [Mortierella alpina]|nr:hypothetical protein BGZ67_008705 [Mortierella alpina]
MSPSTPNVLLTALRGLLKPRFLVVIGTVSVLCILGFHHKDLDTTYRQIPEHFERIGNKILNGENFLQSDPKTRTTTHRLDYAERIYQIGLPRRKELFDTLGPLPFGQLQVRAALLNSSEESNEEREQENEKPEEVRQEEEELEMKTQVQQDLLLLQKQPLSEFRTWFEALEKAGLRPFRSEVDLSGVEPGSRKVFFAAEYSFVNIYGDHSLLQD